MFRSKKDFDLKLDDYYEEDDFNIDENFYSVDADIVSDDENNYKDFFKVNEVEEYDDEDEQDYIEDKKVVYKSDDNSVIDLLSTISTWFIRIGIAIMIILVAVFIIQGKFKTLFLYILGLIGSFILGYLFMYFLVMFTDKN